MCYSAQIWADYRKYTKLFGAVISIREFVDTFWHRRHEVASIKLPKALEAAFEAAPADSDELRQIQQAIAEYKTERAAKLEQELFKQVKRRADAQRVLDSGKVTKKAQEDLRISTAKVDQLKTWLSDLRRVELTDEDARIFPGHYAPVMVWEDGRRVVKPMRYQCRPAGKPAFFDSKVPGHLQRAARQPRRRLLEGGVRHLTRRDGGQCLLRERRPAGRQRGAGVPAAAGAGHAGGLSVVALGVARWPGGAAVVCSDHRRAATRGGGGGA